MQLTKLYYIVLSLLVLIICNTSCDHRHRAELHDDISPINSPVKPELLKGPSSNYQLKSTRAEHSQIAKSKP